MCHSRIKEEKLKDIYQTFHNDVYKIGLYYTRDECTAEDITQKVFYQFYSHMEDVHEECVRAYLIHSARNLSLNWLRDRKREIHGEYLDVLLKGDMLCDSAEDECIKGETDYERKLLINSMLERLGKENESWYQVVNLVLCLGKRPEQVAVELGMSRDVVYSKLYRARKWLRKNFENEYKKL